MRMMWNLLLALFPLSAMASSLSYEDVREIAYRDFSTIVGETRMDAYMPNAKMADVLEEFLGLRNSFVELGPNTIQIAGCRLHSCDEKAAAIVDLTSKKVLAIAVRHFDCHLIPAVPPIPPIRRAGIHPYDCSREPLYLIFVVRNEISESVLESEAKNIALLKNWISGFGGRPSRIQVLLRP